jgi:hypothetical protein
MPFVKGDPNIKKVAEPKEKKKLSRREIREKDLLNLLRKFRPHVSEAILTASRVMKAPTSTEAGKLKAAVIILDNYKELVDNVYDGEDADESGEEIQEQKQSTVFSLRVVDGNN